VIRLLLPLAAILLAGCAKELPYQDTAEYRALNIAVDGWITKCGIQYEPGEAVQCACVHEPGGVTCWRTPPLRSSDHVEVVDMRYCADGRVIRNSTNGERETCVNHIEGEP
jgi:hypothetical protein